MCLSKDRHFGRIRPPNASGVRNPTRTKGDSSFPQPAEGMLSVNFSIQVGRDFWAAQCLNLTDSGVVDGCFSDRAESTPKNLDEADTTRWVAGHQQMHQDLQANLTSRGKGILVSNNVAIPGVFGQMIEGFQATEDAIESLMACAAAGSVCQAHAGYHGDEHASHCADITNVLAAFLVGAGKYSYFACSTGWYYASWDHWNAEFDGPLGEPLAPATKVDGVWTRQFASGTQVRFDTSNNTGVIAWGAS